MMAATTKQAIDDRLAWVRDRAARAAVKPQISASVPCVIERISSPVIAPVLPATMPAVKAHSTKEASFQALANMGLLGLKKGADDVYLVVALACRAGVADLTRREIRELAEKRFERRIDDSWISLG